MVYATGHRERQQFGLNAEHLRSFIDIHASLEQKYSHNPGNSKELEALYQGTSIKGQISECIPNTPSVRK